MNRGNYRFICFQILSFRYFFIVYCIICYGSNVSFKCTFMFVYFYLHAVYVFIFILSFRQLYILSRTDTHKFNTTQKNLKITKSKMDDRDFRYLDRSSMAQSTRGSSVPNEDMQNYLGDTTPGSPVFEKMDSVFETNYASAPPVQVKALANILRTNLMSYKYTIKNIWNRRQTHPSSCIRVLNVTISS